MNTPRLTILLTLKGRHLHTLRWLWHANKMRLPFHVYVADGEVHPSIAKILENPASFPNLSFEYHRYNDQSLCDYYNKCSDALERINTPYTRMADNDDFLFVTGLQKNLHFLDNNQDYVAAQSGVAGFALSNDSGKLSGVTGRILEIKYRYSSMYNSRNLDSLDVIERTLDETLCYYPTYYCVYRTPALQAITEELSIHNFTSTQIHERYWAIRTVSMGKVYSDSASLSYFRQYGTTLRDIVSNDWVNQLVHGSYTEDISKMVTSISKILEAETGKSREEIEERLRVTFGDHLRAWIIERYSKRDRLILRRFLSFVTRSFLYLRRKTLGRDFLLFNRLAADGANKRDIASHRNELGEIEKTLSGMEFYDFVKNSSPGLLEKR